MGVAERERLGHRQRRHDEVLVRSDHGQRDLIAGKLAQRQRSFRGGDPSTNDHDAAR